MDWKRYLWEAFHYDRWGRARLSSAPGSFTGLAMLLGNLNRGREQYPLANVHLPIGRLSMAWNQMEDKERELVTASLCKIVSERGDELRRYFEVGDRDSFYSAATRVDEETVPAESAKRGSRRKRKEKPDGE